MFRNFAPWCAAALLLAGCAGQRTAAVSAEGATPVELHVYMHNPDGSIATQYQTSAQPRPAATGQSAGQYQVTLPAASAGLQPGYAPATNPYAPALVVDAQGETRPTIGAFKGSEPGERVSFTAQESDHIKIVWIVPRAGEMLIVPLTPLAREFRFPVGGQVISPYGWRNNAMHTGTDLKAYPGDTVRAALSGVVRMSKEYGGYGNLVVIRHPNGLETIYGHNALNLVRVNDPVVAGQPIALAGRTGRASTEHVHFEVRSAGRALDPALMVDFTARTLRGDTLYIYNQGEVVMALKGATAPDYFNGAKQGLPAAIAAAGRAYATLGRGHVYIDPTPDAQQYSTAASTPSYGGQGQVYYEGQRAAAPAATYTPPAPTPASTPAYQWDEGQYIYHTMRPKETLFALTRQYGLTIRELLAMNPQIVDPDVVKIGERVRVGRR